MNLVVALLDCVQGHKMAAQPTSHVNSCSLRRLQFYVVAQARIELATPASSGQRSTTELPGHIDDNADE